MAREGLTPKQQRFVQEYLVDLNATQAAIRAGYSPATAENIGWENVRKPEVASAIAEAREAIAQRLEITQDMVLGGLLAEAKGVTDFDDSTPASRVAAWRALGEHLKLFTQKGELTVDARHRVISGEPLDLATWAAKYEAPK